MFRVVGLLLASLCLISSSRGFAAEEPEYSGFLGDYSQLQSRPDSKMIYNYVYEKPGTDFSLYNKFLIEAVTVFPSKNADFKGINANDLALLQKYFHDAVAKALTENEGYQVVEEPGPGTNRFFRDLFS